MAKKRKSKSKVKWGKIGAPHSQERKNWMKKLREKKGNSSATNTEGKKKRKSSSKGASYEETW